MGKLKRDTVGMRELYYFAFCLTTKFQTNMSRTRCYIIADSDKYGKDQVISRDYTLPWYGCVVPEEVQLYADNCIKAAIRFAIEEGYYNLRECRNTYKMVYDRHGYGKEKRCGKESVRPLKYQF